MEAEGTLGHWIGKWIFGPIKMKLGSDSKLINAGLHLSSIFGFGMWIISDVQRWQDLLNPLWAKNCPRFGIAHALCLGLAPWLAAEVPVLVDSGRIKHKDNTISTSES